MNMLFMLEFWEDVVPTLRGAVIHRLFVREARTDVARRREALFILKLEVLK